MSFCFCFFFFSSRRRHTRCLSDWSSDVCSSDLVDPASEAVAMVRGLAAWSRWPTLVNGNGNGNGLTPRGIGWAALFLLGIAAVNLLGPRLFLIVNNVLTAFKILIPLLIVGLLLYTQLHPPAHAVHFPHSGTATTTRY